MFNARHVPRRLWLLLGIYPLAFSALSHEFWLQPAAFFAAPGTRLRMSVFTGSNFAGERWAGPGSRVTLFCHYAPGAAPHHLLPADTLPSTLLFAQPGTHLVALTTNNAFSTLAAGPFNAYLQAEGLTDALTRRELRHETDQPGREAYRRCAKTLVQAGAATATDTARAWARPAGLPLELVPEQNPYRLAPGAAFTVRVLLAGQPLAGQQVALWRRGARPQALLSKLRSNQNGRVLFRLSEPGEYLVSTVRMEPGPVGSGADWQSTWSTLTFALAGPKRL